MLQVSISPSPPLKRLLDRHPRIGRIDEAPATAALSWNDRAIVVGASVPFRGLVELTDNNPLVCAQQFSLPTPGATLGVIGLGPLARAGLIIDDPTMLTNAATASNEVEPFLADLGWHGHVIVAHEEKDLAGVLAATIIVPITTPDRLDDIDDLYDEAYGRSFFVRSGEESDWHVDLVRGTAEAAYRLRISPDQPHSLLTIQVMADRDGKCGAAQVVHAFNVMCGFEESLGIV